MHRSTLEVLMNDAGVYYIYNVGYPIFNRPGSDYYIIIVKKDWECPKVEVGEDDPEIVTIIYTTEEWFNMILHNDILPWECSCLDKKFILKEYVKIMIPRNPLQLRLNYDELESSLYKNIPFGTKMQIATAWKELKFTNQILEDHKIVNYHAIAPVIDAISACNTYEEALECYKKLAAQDRARLNKNTETVFNKYKKAKYEGI